MFLFYRLAVARRGAGAVPDGVCNPVGMFPAPDGVCNPVGMFRFLEVGSYGRRNVTDGVTNPVRRTDAVGRPALSARRGLQYHL